MKHEKTPNKTHPTEIIEAIASANAQQKIEGFWVNTPLEKMTQEQWESLCDGCAKCCTLKLEDEDDGIIYDTDVVCKYLNQETCQCQCYSSRSQKVPDCYTLTKDNLSTINFMPTTCSYRLLLENKPLPDWHPLISLDEQSVHDNHMSVKGKVVCETHAGNLLYHLTGESL